MGDLLFYLIKYYRFFLLIYIRLGWLLYFRLEGGGVSWECPGRRDQRDVDSKGFVVRLGSRAWGL